MPYLNSVPFFRGLSWEERYDVADYVPRELGEKAAAGEITAGLLPLADYFRLADRFDRLGHFGIAVRGRAHSVLLFSRKPIRQLDGATITVTHETSTSALLLRLILEERYHLTPAGYRRGDDRDGDALLLIGDEALRFQQVNKLYPFEIDVAFEWWLWQHLPFVFALWAVRRGTAERDARQIETGLAKALAMNQGCFDAIGTEHEARLGVPAKALQAYLDSFIYRLGPAEEEGINRFKDLLDARQLL